MPDKKTTIEEKNLTSLLSASLETPVCAHALPQLVAAAGCTLTDALGSVWLHTYADQPTGSRFLPTVMLPFPEPGGESMRKPDDIDTLVVTSRVTREGKEEVLHNYYKRPNLLRQELSKNLILLDDGTRQLGLDLQERKVREVRPSALASHRVSASVRVEAYEAMVVQDKRAVKRSGPFQDSINDIPCQRYDFEETMPAQPQLKVPERKTTASLWFSVETGLMLRFDNRSQSCAARGDLRYNVPVDDSLFAIPDWAQGVKPLGLKLVVRDETGRAVPDATVYFGSLGSFKKLHLDAGGQAELPLAASGFQYPPTDELVFGLWSGVVVESADGGEAALYCFDGLMVVVGEGVKVQVEDKEAKGLVLRDFTEEKPGVVLSYSADENTVTLELTLAPKATVTGRIVDEAGDPFSRSSAVITTTYRVRNRTANVAYGQLDAEEPPKGGLNAWDLHINLREGGTFELRLPTNYPLTLALQAVVPPYPPSMWEFTLKPGERVDLGDLVLKNRTPDHPQP